MSPPIRKKEDQIALRNAVKSGVLDLVGTDHCTFTTEQKRMGKGDFRKIPSFFLKRKFLNLFFIRWSSWT